MADTFSFDVFLSHNHNDKPRVRQLAERLKRAGLRVWFDEWNIKAGEIIALKVDEGLERSRVLVLCISPNALASGWVALERSTAVHRDPSNESRRFIPVLLQACKLPDTLRRYKYVDYQDETQTAFQELLASIRPDSTARSPEIESTELGVSLKPTRKQSPLVFPEATLAGNDSWIESLAISPDKRWMASCGQSAYQLVRIWDISNQKVHTTLSNHTSNVRAVAFSPDGFRLFTGSEDKTIRIWDTRTFQQLDQFEVPFSIICFDLLADGKTILLGGSKSNLELWDIESKQRLQRFNTNTEGAIRDVAMHENIAVSGNSESELQVWQRGKDDCIGYLPGHRGRINVVKISMDGRFVLSGGDDQVIKIWDLKKSARVGTLEGQKGSIVGLAFCGDGSILASTAYEDKRAGVLLWNWASGTVFTELRSLEVKFNATITASPDGELLCAGSTTGVIQTFRLGTSIPRAYAAPSTRRYVNAKVVLLGEGTVGKTSLAHRLIADEYVIRDRTHGMNVWRLDLPLPASATLDREALLWDLAGQEDYRLIHQLFLDETALALLLINPQRDDPFAEAGDWLKALEASCKPAERTDVARLLIFSQVDVGSMKLSDAKIDRFTEQYGFKGWLATSAKTGQNCSDEKNDRQPSKLKQLIAESIPWDKLPWTSTPLLLTELKNAVMAMRDERDIRLLRFAELNQRLVQAMPGERFEESDVRTAVKLLANHGLARPLKFGDLVLLQPELLNGYAGTIIRAARANKDEIGSVLEADIYKPDFDFTGVERLKNRPDEELLLRALVQTFLDHSLCIAEDLSNGRHLVFPSQYRREKDIPHDPDIFVSYTFSGEWQTVWTTLVVRLWYSQEFEHKELWRNAAEFASPSGYTLGLKIDHKQGEGTATINVHFDKEVTDDLKAIFIEYVRRHLMKFGYEVSRDRRYVCLQCGKSVTDLAEVRKRIEAKKDFIYCQGCDEKVPLVDVIERRVNSDPVARKISEMDTLATHSLDTQALEQILIGHMMATCGEANQIFRSLALSEHGIDGEVIFKDDNGEVSDNKIYVLLRSWEHFQEAQGGYPERHWVKDVSHLEFWAAQSIDIYLVLRQNTDTNKQVIRWMNLTRYLKIGRASCRERV